ncbi:MAG: Holliday junction branch migration protein RuvA [Parvularcula sp.]
MIGQLTGQIVRVDTETAIINVAGVGYEVSATSRLLGTLAVGQETTLAIETLVAETFIRLVAFPHNTDRQAFRLLQTVQGVGTKAALAILQVLSPQELGTAILSQDKTAISRAQGVGPKLAQRIIGELKDKTGQLGSTDEFHQSATAQGGSTDGEAASSARQDALLALVGLGYDEASARRTLATLPQAEDETASGLIPAALKKLAAP